MRRLHIVVIVALLSLLAVAFVLPASASEACPPPPQRLAGASVGQVAQTFSSIRPAVGSPQTIAVMYSPAVFAITGPAVEWGCHFWYPVEYRGITGWATEGIMINGNPVYWLEPAPDAPDYSVDPVTGVPYRTTTEPCPGAPAFNFAAGDVVEPAQSFSSVRAGIHSDTILDIINVGEQAAVLSGPYCAFGPYNWYEVDFGGTVGFVTSGTGNTYWLQPVTP